MSKVFRCTRTQDYLVLAEDEDQAAEFADDLVERGDWDVSDGMDDEGGSDVYRPTPEGHMFNVRHR